MRHRRRHPEKGLIAIIAPREFELYRALIVGCELTHVWLGHGSAIFMEFGGLTPCKRLDGSAGNPTGQLGVMIEWSWRIERDGSIVCGSFSPEEQWLPALRTMLGGVVTSLDLFSQVPEIAISLSDASCVVSFLTAEGDPAWTIFDRRSEQTRWLGVDAGAIVERSD